MRMRLKIFCGVFVVLCILEYIKAQPDGNDVIQMDYQKSSSTSVKSMGWTEKARSLISGPAGQIVVNLAKEMLSRSTGNSQVLSLNLTNLFVLLFLKALIFSAGLLGTGHWGGGGGYFGRGRSAEKSFLEYEEVPLMLGYLASEGSGQKGCLYRAACLAPYSALDYAKAGHAVLKGSEIFNPDLKHDFHYNHILKGLERAAMEGIENVPCEMVYPCSSWLSINPSAK
ncbi:uncharacterized protein LOC129802972 [Phlebotomus papatasi]|nr:uncharacterized protein LOC129802972 [Phlebotomus papatasi]